MPEVNLTNDWGKADFAQSMKIAGQVCSLINSYNHLTTSYRPENILCRSKQYLALMLNDIVVGCIRVHNQSYTFTELRHLSVLKPYRGGGLGDLIVKESLRSVTTPMVYATIRNTNTSSLSLFGRLGFRIIAPNYLNDNNERVNIAIAETKILKGEYKLKHEG